MTLALLATQAHELYQSGLRYDSSNIDANNERYKKCELMLVRRATAVVAETARFEGVYSQI